MVGPRVFLSKNEELSCSAEGAQNHQKPNKDKGLRGLRNIPSR